jgi:hypothetical protein
MWEAATIALDGGKTLQIAVRRGGKPAAYERVVQWWQHDPAFRAWFVDLLGRAPFAAYRWETPPVTAATAGRDFEFVLLDSPALDRTPDPHPFAEQFEAATTGQSVVTFPNLSGDAVLVVPRPASNHSTYGHLAAFVRHAPEPQKHELWRSVGVAMEARLGNRPIWLSTAGMGVPWLHVRLDSRPKYYGFRPYAEATSSSSPRPSWLTRLRG